MDKPNYYRVEFKRKFPDTKYKQENNYWNKIWFCETEVEK